MDKHVFISYKHEDCDFAEVLSYRVEKEGFKTWTDSYRLGAGEDWRTDIDQAIQNAFALVVIMTPEAKESEYVTYEWAFAWGAGVKVIPVLYKKTSLHPRLEALQYLDFSGRTNRPWDTLIESIRNAVNAPRSSNILQKARQQWLEAGNMFLHRKDYQAALDAYMQAILLDHNDSTAYAGRGEAFYRLKQYKDALAAIQQAIDLNPTIALTWDNKGRILHALARYEEALATLEQAIHFDPDSAGAWNSKGLILKDLKRYEEALESFEQAIRLAPTFARAWNNKGSTLNTLKCYHEALIALEQAIRLDPTFASAWNNKGVSLSYLERYDEAMVAFEEAIRFDADYTLAQNNRRIILNSLNKME